MFVGLRSRSLPVLVALSSLAAWNPHAVHAAVDRGFSYQGQLKDAGRPVTDTCDVRFKLRTDPFGTDNTDVLGTNVFDGHDSRFPSVAIRNGLFQVELDFSPDALAQAPVWLDIAVRCPAGSGGAYVGLMPRQPITAAPYAIQTRGIVVDAAGHVGIGTNTPTQPLHVTGNIRADKVTIGDTPLYGSGVAIRRMEPQLFPNPPVSRGADIAYDGTRLSLFTETTVDPPHPVNGLVIDNLGRVGIGTTSLAGKLTVDGLVESLNAGFKFPDGTVQTTAASAGGSLWSAKGNDVYYSGGKVGIGTNTPKQALHNTGDYYGKGHLWLYAYQGDGQNGTAYVQARDDSGTSSIGLNLRTQNAGSLVDALSLSPLGGVGIGIRAPAMGLWVRGLGLPGFGAQVVIDSSDTSGDVDSGSSIHFTNQSSFTGTYLGALSCFKENGDPTRSDHYLSLATKANNNPPQERMRITSDGKVGIGTSDPADRLSVTGGMLTLDSGPSGALTGIRLREDGGLRWTFLYRTWQGDDLHIYNEQRNESAMTLTAATGRVGIGTTDPRYRFDVVSHGATPTFDDWAAHFKDTNGTGEAWLAGNDGFGHDYGIETRGAVAGGFFHDTAGWAEARLAHTTGVGHKYGVWAKGTNAGGYFENGTYDAHAYLGYGETAIDASGRFEGGHFKDTNDGTSASIATGVFSIFGNGVKAFVENHPYDKKRVIVYAAPEGDEVATYTRGTARLVNGEARVPLGATFKWVTNSDIGLTAHLTPRGDCGGLYVASVTTTELVVRELQGGTSNTTFDYLVYGLRIGFEETAVVREKQREAPIPSMASQRQRYAIHPELRKFNALERFKRMRTTIGVVQPLTQVASQALHDAIGEFDPTVRQSGLRGMSAMENTTRMERGRESEPARATRSAQAAANVLKVGTSDDEGIEQLRAQLEELEAVVARLAATQDGGGTR